MTARSPGHGGARRRGRGSGRTKRPLLATAVAVLLAAVVGASLVHHFAPSRQAPGAGHDEESLPALRVLEVTPASGSEDVSFDAAITIRFSRAPSPQTPLPTLRPAVEGTWARPAASLLVFHPAGSYVPDTPYHLTIPLADHAQLVDSKAASTGDEGAGGAVRSSFTIRAASTLRLQQLLAELDYLPVAFQPLGVDSEESGSALSSEPVSASLVSPDPEEGRFTWPHSGVPPELRALWQPGDWSVLVQGAVMAFESQHGLTVDGVPGPEVWGALLDAVAERQVSDAPYRFFLVTEQLPETLEVWSGGRVVLSTIVNTGASGARTPLGAWPVFLRLRSATMTGTNPNGTHYVDHGVPDVAYFHGSDAVHGFFRAAYGFPQSNGCVEVPLDVASAIYSLDALGTVVDVTNLSLGGSS